LANINDSRSSFDILARLLETALVQRLLQSFNGLNLESRPRPRTDWQLHLRAAIIGVDMCTETGSDNVFFISLLLRQRGACGGRIMGYGMAHVIKRWRLCHFRCRVITLPVNCARTRATMISPGHELYDAPQRRQSLQALRHVRPTRQLIGRFGYARNKEITPKQTGPS